jgi:DNA-binding IclR family transcriptional regulator
MSNQRPSNESSGRASPPTERVVAVLDFLARHPHDRFGVSELARRLGLSKPTCLGIVGTLAAADYLVRDAQDKTYRLGPALISLGHTAQESMRVNPAAREELRRLSSTYDTTAALSAIASRCSNSSGRQVRTSGCASDRATRSPHPSA